MKKKKGKHRKLKVTSITVQFNNKAKIIIYPDPKQPGSISLSTEFDVQSGQWGELTSKSTDNTYFEITGFTRRKTQSFQTKKTFS